MAKSTPTTPVKTNKSIPADSKELTDKKNDRTIEIPSIGCGVEKDQLNT